MHQKHSYIANDGGEIEDSILKIKMPLAKIFGKKAKAKLQGEQKLS